MERVRIKASKEYDVVIGSGVFETLGKELSALTKGGRVAIIADNITFALFGARAKKALSDEGFSVCEYVIENGESSKNAENYIRILEFLQFTIFNVIFYIVF